MTSIPRPGRPARSFLAAIRRAHPATMSVLVAASLAGCGGGGNELGPSDHIQLSQDALTAQGSATACATGKAPTIFVYGGQPPYTVRNSFPDGMSIDKSSVGEAGEGFTITFKGICMQDIAVPVEDDMGRIATLLVSNELGQ
jgi:hypothetical protein